MTAIGIIVSLAALEPLIGVGHRTAIFGFANTATIPVVAMYMLTAGIQRTACARGDDRHSIVIAALAGVFLMIVSGCLSTAEAYDAVSWNTVFLLTGVIPLGVALVAKADFVPLIGVLLLFTIVTGLLANVITPVATVVLMIPIAVDAATTLGAQEFSFLLAMMFASATSFMTPVGYQTNLMMYGPGGYEVTGFLRAGGPL